MKIVCKHFVVVARMSLFKVQHAEQEQILHLIKRARKDPSWELEVRFEDVPSGNKGRRAFSPCVTLNSFLHIKSQIAKEKACVYRGETVMLDTIYKEKIRKTEKIEHDKINTICQKKVQYSKFDSNYGFRVSLSKESDQQKADTSNPQIVRLKRRSSFTVYNGPDRSIPVWTFDLTISQSAKVISDPPAKVDRIIQTFHRIFENIKTGKDPEESIIRDFGQEQYEIELEYIGNKNIFQMRTLHVYEILMSLIGWILANNRAHAVRGCLLSKDDTKLVIDQYLNLVGTERYDIEIDGLNYDQLVRRYAMQTQKSEPMIRQEFVTKENIIFAFKTLDSLKVGSITDYFIGPQPVAMTRADLDLILPEEYCLQKKIDGERNLLFVSPVGIVYLIGRDMYIKRTNVPRITDLSSSIVDGEFIRDPEGKNHFYPFDIIAYDGTDLRGKKEYTFIKRMGLLRKFLRLYPTNQECLTIQPEYLNDLLFDFKTPLGDNVKLAFNDNTSWPPMDGLVFRPKHKPLPKLMASQTWWSCFKWKPSHENTIDFQLQRDNDEINAWNLMCRTQIIPIEIKGVECETTVLSRTRENGKRFLNVYVKELEGETRVEEKKVMRNPHTRKRTRTEMLSFGSVIQNPSVGKIKIQEPQAKRLCIVDRCVAECRFDKKHNRFEPLKVNYKLCICNSMCLLY